MGSRSIRMNSCLTTKQLKGWRQVEGSETGAFHGDARIMKLYCEGSSEGYNLRPYNVPFMSSRVVLRIFFWNVSSVSSWFCQSLKLTAIKEAPLESDLTQALKLKGTAIIVQSYQYCIQCRINYTQRL